MRTTGRDGSARDGHSRRCNDRDKGESRRFNSHLRRVGRDLGRLQWRRRRSDRDEAIGFPNQPHSQNASRWAGSCRPAQHPAAQSQRHSPLLQKKPLQQPRPAANDHNQGTYGCLPSEKLPPPSIVLAGSGRPLQQAIKLEGREDVYRSGPAEPQKMRKDDRHRGNAASATSKEIRPPCGPRKRRKLFQMFGAGSCRTRLPGSNRMSSLSPARTPKSFLPSSEGADQISQARGCSTVWSEMCGVKIPYGNTS